jgi:hypothetical protein
VCQTLAQIIANSLTNFISLLFFFIWQDDDRAGFDLGATGRLALMAKLAEGTGNAYFIQYPCTGTLWR